MNPLTSTSAKMRLVKLICFGLLFVLIILLATWQLSRSTTYQLFGDIISHIETDQPVIALTFDDGPSPQYLQNDLETLASSSTPATFFLVGQDVRAHPDLARSIAQAGHEIGNHSFSHPRMLLMSPNKIAQEIEATDAAIRDTGYQGPIHFRPPFGKKLVTLPRYLAKHNRPAIMWDIAPENWQGSIEQRADQITREVKPGSIILLHIMYKAGDGARQFLPVMIKRLKSQGYEFVTLSELLAHSEE